MIPAVVVTSGYDRDGRYRRELVERCGHFPQREHTDLVAKRLLAWLRQPGACELIKR